MFAIPPTYDRARVQGFKDMLESGEFTPVIDRRYRLDQIVDAYRYVETGQKIGNVVITVVPVIEWQGIRMAVALTRSDMLRADRRPGCLTLATVP
jgi:hypothetical protein